MNEAVFKHEEVVVHGWRFTRLSQDDRQYINSQLNGSSCPSRNWYNDFSFFWFFDQARPDRQVVWKLLGGLVVPFVISGRRRKAFLLRPPFGEGNPDQYFSALYMAMAFCYHYNGGDAKATFVRSVDEAELEFMQGSSLFREHFRSKVQKGIEHHYEIARLGELEGSGFAYVRRKLSKLSRRHPNHVVRPYTDDDRGRMDVLFERWLDDARTPEDRARKKKDRKYFNASLDYGSRPDHLILVAEVDGELAGMISGGARAVGDAWCFERKTLHAYEGLAELLVVELARAVQAQDGAVQFLNDGSDMGDPGLRYFKQRFQPGRMLTRYRLFGTF